MSIRISVCSLFFNRNLTCCEHSINLCMRYLIILVLILKFPYSVYFEKKKSFKKICA